MGGIHTQTDHSDTGHFDYMTGLPQSSTFLKFYVFSSRARSFVN